MRPFFPRNFTNLWLWRHYIMYKCNVRHNTKVLVIYVYFQSKLWTGSCTSELQLKVNCSIDWKCFGKQCPKFYYNSLYSIADWKWNVKKIFGPAWHSPIFKSLSFLQLSKVNCRQQIRTPVHNSLWSAIHLNMIRPLLLPTSFLTLRLQFSPFTHIWKMKWRDLTIYWKDFLCSFLKDIIAFGDLGLHRRRLHSLSSIHWNKILITFDIFNWTY